MKKLLIIGLLLVYGFSSLGMTIHFHYCCGKLKQIEMTVAKEKDCGGQMDGRSCCEDKQISSSNTADQEFAFAVVEQAKVFNVPSLLFSQVQPIRPAIQKAAHFISFDTGSSSPPLFISNCTFRL